MAQGNAKKIGLDHGDLVGKGDDDHTQYLNNTRHANYHSSISISLTSDQSIPNNTLTLAEFDTVVFQNDADGDYTAESNGVTVNTAGLYLLIVGADWASNSTGDRLLLARANSSTVVTDRRTATISSNATMSTILSLSAADFIDLLVLQSRGSPLDLEANPGTFLSLVRIA